MTNLRDAAVIIGVSLVAVAWFQSRPQTFSAVETATPSPVLSTTEPSQAAPIIQGGSLTLHARGGQYWTEGDANGARVRFLVDTGASAVALRLEDARAAGLRDHELDYRVVVQTANGETRAAPVKLRALRVGPITLRDVDALVVQEGLSVSLLGMSFLGRLQKFEAGRDRMTLTL